MLDDLTTLDWTRLEDAEGPATSLPDLLRAIAASDGTKGGEAKVAELADRVDHQGWPSPAATAVVPFLWELVVGTSGATRARLLRLLADLSVGGSHENFVGFGVKRAPAAMLLSDAPGKELRVLVATRGEEALGFLRDKSAPVRAAAAMLVALIAPMGASEALVAALAKEKSKKPRADLAMALGILGADLEGERERQPIEKALRPLLDEQDPVRAGAAVALGTMGALDARTHAALSVAVGGNDAKPVDSVWNGGRIADHATRVFIARAAGPDGVALLGVLLEHAAPKARGGIASALMRSVFSNELRAEPHGLDARSLTKAQRDVLRLIQAHDEVYGLPDDPIPLMQRLAIPMVPWELGAWLGDPPRESPLDGDVVHAGQTRTVRELWLETATERSTDGPDVAASIVSARSPEACVDIAIEGHQLRTAWGRKSDELFLLLLDRAGAKAAPGVRAAIDELARTGPPKLWAHGPNGARAVSLGLLLAVALASIAELTPEEHEHLRTERYLRAPNTETGLAAAPEIGARAKTMLARHREVVSRSSPASGPRSSTENGS